jgi:hypothetical protein
MKLHFSARRFWNLLKREEFMRWRGLALAALTLGGVTVLLTLMNGLQGEPGGNLNGLYSAFLFIGGFMVASGAFRAMHTKESAHDWLMLPASGEEKFLSRLLSSSIGYWLFLTLIFSLAVPAGRGLSLLIAGRGGDFFNPLDPGVLRLLPHYLILQSVFIAGGAFFRKHQFLKTVLFLSLFGIVLGFFSAFGLRLVFGDFFQNGFDFSFSGEFGDPAFPVTQEAGMFLIKVLKIVYFGLTAPFFWLAAWLRVREAEVRHAL